MSRDLNGVGKWPCETMEWGAGSGFQVEEKAYSGPTGRPCVWNVVLIHGWRHMFYFCLDAEKWRTRCIESLLWRTSNQAWYSPLRMKLTVKKYSRGARHLRTFSEMRRVPENNL